MILTLLRIGWLNLCRDRVAQLLTFVLPVAFFTIFALLLGGFMNGDGTNRVKVIVVDEDRSDAGRAFVKALQSDRSLNVLTQWRAERGAPWRPYDRATAEQAVKERVAPVAIVIPPGFADSIGFFGAPDTGTRRPVELLADKSDPIAPQMVAGLMQRAAMTAMPDAMARRGIEMFEKYAGGLTAGQRAVVDAWFGGLAGGDSPGPASQAATGEASSAASSGGQSGIADGLIAVKIVDLFGEKKRSPAMAYQAAATAVLFLLFACANGGGGSLLEEEENGTIQRLLSSRLSMTQLLLGKWLFFVFLGVAQVTLMFVYGWAFFGIELFTAPHLAGFLLMTLATAAAASAFGILLATLCRSRAQLGGLSTIIILMMSALGGSMIPRYVMGPQLQALGYATFNAWALDGFQKVFWYEAGVPALWPQLLMLGLLTFAFLVGARLLARRWERS